MATAEPRYSASDNTTSRDNLSIADLLRELRNETTTLFRQEVQLAKTEMTDKAQRVGRNLAYLAVGGLVAYLGAAFLLVGLMYLIHWGLTAAGVEEVVSAWISALAIGIIVGAIGYALVQKAISTLKHESVMPEETVRSLQENRQWAQQKLT